MKAEAGDEHATIIATPSPHLFILRLHMLLFARPCQALSSYILLLISHAIIAALSAYCTLFL